jgi:hypothetical protein
VRLRAPRASAANGLIRVGTGNVVGQKTLMFWQDPQERRVDLAAVATGWGSEGDWVVCIPEQCTGKLDATVRPPGALKHPVRFP